MAGKRIVNAYKTIDKTQAYALKEAVKIVKSNATAKFDETIDVASTSVSIRNMPIR